MIKKIMNHEWVKKYILTKEFLAFAIILGLCLFFYFKYDHHKIRVDIEDIDYTPLFDLARHPLQRRKPKRKKVLKHETKCREIFEKIFHKSFPSIRPSFLKNPATKQNLELDGYCESLKLAFEYDGSQHSQYNPHFHKNGKQEFIYQVAKDDYKSKKCKLEGIDLVRIPHFVHFENLEEYIRKELKRIGRL